MYYITILVICKYIYLVFLLTKEKGIHMDPCKQNIRPGIRPWRRYPRPSSDKRACRSSGVVCVPASLGANHDGIVHIINAKHCISSVPKRAYLVFGEYIIESQVDTRWRVMRYKGGVADLDDMHRTSRGDDIPSLRLE